MQPSGMLFWQMVKVKEKEKRQIKTQVRETGNKNKVRHNTV